MITYNTVCDILDAIDRGTMNNISNSNYIVFMKRMHNFILENDEILHFDYQLDFLTKANYIIVKLYETSNSELENDYYEPRRVILGSLQRSEDGKK